MRNDGDAVWPQRDIAVSMVEVPVCVDDVINAACSQFSNRRFDFSGQLRELVVDDEHAVVSD